MSGRADLFEYHTIIHSFAKHGLSAEILELKNGTSISQLAIQAAKQNHDIIVGGGGDGTINAVAAALVGHPSARLGVLPFGTLNHFARNLGIPLDVSQAIDVICAGHSKAIDVGVANECCYVAMSRAVNSIILPKNHDDL